MKKEGWQAYIHINDTIQIKKYVEGILEIDLNSPFIKKYLGELLDTDQKQWTREEAEQYFLKELGIEASEK